KLQNHRLGFMKRPEDELAAAEKDQERNLGILAAALNSHPYVAGEHITIADLALVSMFSFAEEAALSAALPPPVRRWFAALGARPSWQSTERMKQETLAAYGIKF